MQKRQNSICYKDIGTVTYRWNSRARRLSIRINRKGEVAVTVPGRMSVSRAEAFFLSRRDWVLGKLEGIREAAKTAPSPRSGDMLLLRGEYHVLLPKKNETDEQALWRLLRNQAVDYLPGRLAELGQEKGFSYTGLKIRKMTSRWGSCTARNSINLNSWLIVLPAELSDYVLLHELCHTKHPNHGPGFWQELDRATNGNAKLLQRKLRAWQISHFPAERIARERRA